MTTENYIHLNEILNEVAKGNNRYHLMNDEITELVQVMIGARKTTIHLKVRGVLLNCGFEIRETWNDIGMGWVIV